MPYKVKKSGRNHSLFKNHLTEVTMFTQSVIFLIVLAIAMPGTQSRAILHGGKFKYLNQL